MERLIVFPYNADCFGLVQYLNRKKKYTVSALLSPVGYGLSGKDAAYAVNRPKIGLTVMNDVVMAMNSGDTLLIAPYRTQCLKQQCLSLIKQFLTAHKNVICMMPLTAEQRMAFQKLSQEMRVSFRCLEDDKLPEYIQPDASDIQYIPSVPVIAVGGFWERCGQDEVVLGLKAYFEQMGYKVSCLMNKAYGSVLQAHSYPESFYDRKQSEDERIRSLNHWIEALLKIEKPELFFVELPETLFQSNNHSQNHYGVTAYMACQAISIDHLICCTDNEMYNELFWKNMSNTLKGRYGAPITAVYRDNCIINHEMLDLFQNEECVFAPSNEIECDFEPRVFTAGKIDALSEYLFHKITES